MFSMVATRQWANYAETNQGETVLRGPRRSLDPHARQLHGMCSGVHL